MEIFPITFSCLCQDSGFGLKARLVPVLMLVPGPLLFSRVVVEINSDLTLWSCSGESQEDCQKCSFLGSLFKPSWLSLHHKLCCRAGGVGFMSQSSGIEVVWVFFWRRCAAPLLCAMVNHRSWSAPEMDRGRGTVRHARWNFLSVKNITTEATFLLFPKAAWKQGRIVQWVIVISVAWK